MSGRVWLECGCCFIGLDLFASVEPPLPETRDLRLSLLELRQWCHGKQIEPVVHRSSRDPQLVRTSFASLTLGSCHWLLVTISSLSDRNSLANGDVYFAAKVFGFRPALLPRRLLRHSG